MENISFHDGKLVGEAELERKPMIKFIDFFNMSTEEYQELNEAVQASNGIVRLFVHPFYNDSALEMESWPISGINKEGEEQNFFAKHPRNPGEGDTIIQRGLDRVITNGSVPVLIMQRIDEIEALRERLESEKNSSIYVVPTMIMTRPKNRIIREDDSTPVMPDSYKAKLDSNDQQLDDYWIFVRALEDLGVKKIILGGKQLRMGVSAPSKMIVPYGCVGQAFKYLSSRFEINISNFASPHNQNELNAIQDWIDVQESGEINKP